jgi:trk system potassium uptake protein
VVDLDAARLAVLQDRFDLCTVRGHVAHPEVLKQAGTDDADMLVAVTQSDETNLVACRIASTLFNVPTHIARIRFKDFLGQEEGFLAEHFGVDHVISPEQEVTDTLRRLIEHPEALQVLDFAKGKMRLIAVCAYHGGPLVGHELQGIKRHIPNLECRIPAVYRRWSASTMRGRG